MIMSQRIFSSSSASTWMCQDGHPPPHFGGRSYRLRGPACATPLSRPAIPRRLPGFSLLFLLVEQCNLVRCAVGVFDFRTAFLHQRAVCIDVRHAYWVVIFRLVILDPSPFAEVSALPTYAHLHVASHYACASVKSALPSNPHFRHIRASVISALPSYPCFRQIRASVKSVLPSNPRTFADLTTFADLLSCLYQVHNVDLALNPPRPDSLLGHTLLLVLVVLLAVTVAVAEDAPRGLDDIRLVGLYHF